MTGRWVGRLPSALIVASVLGTGALAVEVAIFVRSNSPLLADTQYIAGVTTSPLFLFVLGYGGYRLRNESLSVDRYGRIAQWTGIGIAASVAFNGMLIPLLSTGGTAQILRWVRWAVLLGAATGFLIGIVEARAIERAVTAERRVVEQEHLERRSELLEYLNGILRHEVLNGVSVVAGYAERIQEQTDHDDPEHEWAQVIEEEAKASGEVVEDVRALVRTLREDYRSQSVDLMAAVRTEREFLLDEHPDTTVTLDGPETLFVRADRDLHRVVRILLSNAVEHNDTDSPEIAVTVTVEEEMACLSVTDDGPGIPEALRSELFDRGDNWGSNHGMGLYLARLLVERYGGEIELADTSSKGSRFTVHLQLAADTEGPVDIEDQLVDPEASADSGAVSSAVSSDDLTPDSQNE